MTIQSIIKKAIKRLELENKLLTPDFYAEAFCKEAKKAGMNTEDCIHIEKFSKTLNEDTQKELKNYRIQTMGELARFLISKLNRTNSTICSELLESQMLLTKRILQVVEVLHNRQAGELAKQSIKLLGSNPTSVELNQFRQHWINFITTYDDSFLNKLEYFGKVDNRNLKKTIENINIALSDTNENNSELVRVASLLVSSFVPSIASSVNDKIASLSQKIQSNPTLLDSISIEEEVKTIISLRIALDKESVKEMVESIDGVLDKLSLRLIEMIERSDDSTIEIQKIKTDLENYNDGSVTNFKISHKKLLVIATALEETTQTLSKDLRGHSNEVNALSIKVNKLEKELKDAKQISKEDFLTKLYNKRALDEFMKVKEAEYSRYGHNFSVVMFDLDHFKDVNDNYGHDAGDAVLAAFAKILKKEARSVDIVGRFGGEEFMALLSETGIEGGVVFAQKVRKHVQKARFMYKNQRIHVTISCGVSERKKCTSLKNVVTSSDENLYKAKKDGRNQVVYK
ncbi:diguanylate cyclase [Sulfurimonas sp.]|uniref:GGDEF domain-containing protein n=1 Tax=Sulfurimonas sp. TaxID=2022749 RepID=UPI002B465963|nr:diguanylate cyclase [Sulfurimonas sp.]